MAKMYVYKWTSLNLAENVLKTNRTLDFDQKIANQSLIQEIENVDWQ